MSCDVCFSGCGWQLQFLRSLLSLIRSGHGLHGWACPIAWVGSLECGLIGPLSGGLVVLVFQAVVGSFSSRGVS